jgi:hypothetical protein
MELASEWGLGLLPGSKWVSHLPEPGVQENWGEFAETRKAPEGSEGSLWDVEMLQRAQVNP